MVEVEVALDHVANDFELRIAREGHLAGEHNVEHDAQRPDIDLGVVVLKEDFWRDVVRLSRRRSGEGG